MLGRMTHLIQRYPVLSSAIKHRKVTQLTEKCPTTALSCYHYELGKPFATPA